MCKLRSHCWSCYRTYGGRLLSALFALHCTIHTGKLWLLDMTQVSTLSFCLIKSENITSHSISLNSCNTNKGSWAAKIIVFSFIFIVHLHKRFSLLHPLKWLQGEETNSLTGLKLGIQRQMPKWHQHQNWVKQKRLHEDTMGFKHKDATELARVFFSAIDLEHNTFGDTE